MKRAVLVLVGVMALGSCGGKASAGTAPTASTAVGPTPTTIKTGTVGQFAGAIAKSRAQLLALYPSVERCAMGWTTCGAIRQIESSTYAITVTTIGLDLQLAERDNGVAPAEIRALVADTRSAAATAQTWAEEVRNCHSDDAECPILRLHLAAMDLQSELAKWEPYL